MSSDSAALAGVPRPRKRQKIIPVACNYCRYRKIRCDGKNPCDNCTHRKRTCEYKIAEDDSQAKSNLEEQLSEHRSFIDLLSISSPSERESLLRERLGKRTPETDDSLPMNGSDGTPNSSIKVGDSDEGHKIASLRHLHVGIDGQVKFHGPTSAFSDSPNFVQPSPENPTSTTSMIPEDKFDSAETKLSEGAAESRQAEVMNLASGRLDFDGVKPEMGMHLLGIHWARQHHALLLTYRPAFMRDMGVEGGGKYFSKLLLNAIYFGASKFSPHTELRADPDDPRTAGFVFLKRVKELLGNAIGRSKITTAQALLLLASSLFALGEQQSSWLYSGLAFRMIIDLGLHIENTAFDPSLTVEDIEIRRRVFYGAFCFDKIHSLYQGRPCALQESEIRVPLVFWDVYEENELWRPFPRPPPSEFRPHRYHPGVPMVCNEFYGLQRPVRPMQRLKILDSDIEQWSNELPSHLQFDPLDRDVPCPSANVFALHCLHSTLIILLHRPFVSHGHLRELVASGTENSWQRCNEAADRVSDILELYGKALSWQRAPFLISYCAYISATIHVRMASQLGPRSNAARRLQHCLNAFSETEKINTGVARPKQVLESLMRELGVSSPQSDGQVPAGIGTDTAEFGQRSSNTDAENLELDMDALIRSFVADQPQGFEREQNQTAALPDNQSSNSFVAPPDGSILGRSGQMGDPLFGLMNDWDVSPFEALLRTHELP